MYIYTYMIYVFKKNMKLELPGAPRTPGNWRLWDAGGVGHLFLLVEGGVHVAWPSVVGGKCWLEVGPQALYWNLVLDGMGPKIYWAHPTGEHQSGLQIVLFSAFCRAPNRALFCVSSCTKSCSKS